MLISFIQLQSMISCVQPYGFVIGNVESIILEPVIEGVIRHIQHVLYAGGRNEAMPLVQITVDEILREIGSVDLGFVLPV